MLAKFYLSENRKESLKGFAESTGTFQIALGGDGCPFGKIESTCSFLVSFLNVGRRVASSYDNFLIFGANCDESSPVTKKYVRSLLPQLAELERAEYEFEGIKDVRANCFCASLCARNFTRHVMHERAR